MSVIGIKRMLKRAAAIGALLVGLGVGAGAQADGPPRAELHVWGGNNAAESGSFDLRTVEVGLWPTRQDRIGLRYDNSLSLDNPTLARQGTDAEAYFVSYLHDFDGKFLLQGEIGKRDLPNGADQDIYKVETVVFNDGAAIKLGAQASPTETATGDFTDKVVWGAYNFAAGEHWRLEPALYLSETGGTEDREWRAAAYGEYTPSEAWQVGVGAGYGEIDSDIPGASGDVVNAHARLSYTGFKNHAFHVQVRYEDAPLQNFTVGLVGVTLRLPRG